MSEERRNAQGSAMELDEIRADGDVNANNIENTESYNTNTDSYNSDSYNTNTESYNTNTDSYNTYNIYYNQIRNELDSHHIDSLENSNNRTWLKTQVGKRVRVWGYAVDEYDKYSEKIDDDYVRYTVINIHNRDTYIADHLQIDIPIEKFDSSIRQQMIRIDGLVYEYKEGRKQSIKATDVIISHYNKININTDFKPNIKPIVNESDFRERLQAIRELSPSEKTTMLLSVIDTVNSVISLPKNFITNFIINHYSINYDPDLLNRSDFNVILKHESAVCEISFILYSIIKRLYDGEIMTIYALLQYISNVLNGMHSVLKDPMLATHNRVIRMQITKGFRNFCIKHNLDQNKAYRYIRTRNMNFRFSPINPIEVYYDAFEIILSDNPEDDYLLK